MPVKLNLLSLTDFTGGLNYDANVVQLRGNESPDMMNVDLDPRGGFAMRKGVDTLHLQPLPTRPFSIFTHQTTTGTKQVLIARGLGTPVSDCEIMSSTGGNFATVTTPAGHTNATPHRAVTFKDLTYIQNGVDEAMEYTGAALAELQDPTGAGAFANDYAAPTSAGENDMPIGKCIAAHLGRIFVANTLENGTAFANRVRFSHPNYPKAWRSQDYFDVDTGSDGDYITALLPFGAMLLVFKNKSMHVITGYDAGSFQQAKIADVGAPSQEAVLATNDTVYFFSWPAGVHAWNGRGQPAWLWQRIFPKVEDGSILASAQDEIALGWVNHRLWVSLTEDGASNNNTVYVYDPHIGFAERGRERGGWTKYDLELGPFCTWQPPATEARHLAVHARANWVMELDNHAIDADQWGEEYLLLDGTGDFVSTPDQAALDITSDIDLRAETALDDWTPAATSTVVAKWGAAGQRSYALRVSTAGALVLEWSNDGTTIRTATSTVTLPAAIAALVNGQRLKIRATLDVDNGAGNHTVTFYYSVVTTGDLTSATWTQLGATTNAGTGAPTAIFASTALLYVGAVNGTADLDGKVWRVQVRNGIAGTVVVDSHFGAEGNIDTTTNNIVWTYAGDATLSGGPIVHNIATHYCTKFVDAEVLAQDKRWKRPEILVSKMADAILHVQVFRNWDRSVQKSSFNITIDADSAGGVWGDNWGTLLWSSASDTDGAAIKKGATLGKARSVQLKFNGPAVSARWWVSAITFKYQPLRIRN